MQAKLLAGYEPQAFFHWFEELIAIPHPTFHEEKMVNFVTHFAEERNLFCEVSGDGNILIRLPPSPTYEKEPAILLQGHLDMVCVKDPGMTFDFAQDSIQLKVKDDIVTACGTTLGADNVVGIATMLAIADSPGIPHPPLELLFTVQEEVALRGIRNYDLSKIKARRMVNLDSGYSHEMCVCGAGGTITSIIHTFAPEPAPADQVCLELTISGGIGGHTGICIHLGRGCAANLTGELLHALEQIMPVRLASFAADGSPGSILNNFSCLFAVPANQWETATDVIKTAWACIKGRFIETDPGLQCTIQFHKATHFLLNPADSHRAINLLYLFHTGAQKHDGSDPAIVIASSAVSAVSLVDGKLEMDFRIRSTDDTVQQLVVGRYQEIAALMDIPLKITDQYPGWPLRRNSEMQNRFIKCHEQLFGRALSVEHMHAGVEVGVVVGAIPDMDAVGISPTSTDAHTTDEKLYLKEVKPFWDLLLSVLAERS